MLLLIKCRNLSTSRDCFLRTHIFLIQNEQMWYIYHTVVAKILHATYRANCILLPLKCREHKESYRGKIQPLHVKVKKNLLSSIRRLRTVRHELEMNYTHFRMQSPNTTLHSSYEYITKVIVKNVMYIVIHEV